MVALAGEFEDLVDILRITFEASRILVHVFDVDVDLQLLRVVLTVSCFHTFAFGVVDAVLVYEFVKE